MPTAVFDTANVQFPVVRGIRFNTITKSLGDGFEQRTNKNLAWSHANGTTGSPTSIKGIFYWRIQARVMPHLNGDSTKQANKIWEFYIARLGGFEAFYFYDPIESPATDLTGNSTVGRHLVVFAEQNLEYEEFMTRVCSAQLSLREVRS
jgi:hypothetical protein